MLNKAKFRRKARRIAISEIMIPVILLTVLGFTSVMFIIKLSKNEIEQIFTKEERVEIKWIINLGVVMAYGILDLALAFLLYTGIKEKSYWKCNVWVYLQIIFLCIFTVVVMKRCNATIGGFHFFEFIALCVCIYIYKIHHIAFVYGLLVGLRSPSPIKTKAKVQTAEEDQNEMFDILFEKTVKTEPDDVICKVTSI